MDHADDSAEDHCRQFSNPGDTCNPILKAGDDNPKDKKQQKATIRSVYGLEWPEPLVTFALSSGSRSSPTMSISICAYVCQFALIEETSHLKKLYILKVSTI